MCKLLASKGKVEAILKDLMTRKEVDDYTYKYAGIPKLEYINEGKPFAYCSGSVIGPKTILSAAHCYQGTINQDIKVETIAIMKRVKKVVDGKETLVRMPYCVSNPYWSQDPRCVVGKLRAEITTTYDDVYAECFNDKLDVETVDLNINKGWPNSLMANLNSRRRFDFAILHTDQIISNTTSLSYSTDKDLLNSTIDRANFGLSCKIYGFGPSTPEEEMGPLKEMQTTLSRSHRTQAVSFKDVTNNGDSGGPILCPINGKDQIVGVVSRSLGNTDVFTLLAENSIWLEKTLGLSEFVRKNKNDFDEIALSYEIDTIKREMDITQSCLKKNKNNINSPSSRFTMRQFKNGIKEVKKLLKEATCDPSEKAVYQRGFLRDVYNKSIDLRLACEQSS